MEKQDDRTLVIRVSDGNPGAARLCCELLSVGRRDIVEKMREKLIIGPRVWLTYKDLGDESIERLIENVESEDIVERLIALGY